jgi:hypothetical protein
MWSWLLIGLLYLGSMGFLRWLGGIGAVADAIAGWGRTTAERRRRTASAS